MKRFLLAPMSILFLMLFMLLSFNSPAMALHPGTLLEVKNYGGFVTPEFVGHENGVRVLRNGIVIAFNKKNDLSTENSIIVASLAPTVMRKLLDLVKYTEAGELLDENPDAPMCADIPTTDYALRQTDGTIITFASDRNCKKYFIADYRSRGLRDLLAGFQSLNLLQ
ncbi:MAG: hypothetical protein HQK50_14935 [Oligoflexia bacterium]|nr:hypothetical protein [Oligoflexia bacterium]